MPAPDARPAPPKRGLTLAFTLLLAMLAVVILSVGSTFLFSNLAVQREFQKLPPEVQTYLRAQQEAARRGEILSPLPPTPEIRTGTPADPYLPDGTSSPDVSGVIQVANGDDITVEQGQRVRRQVDSNVRTPPRGFAPRTEDFLRQVQRNMIQVGLIAALASALLAYLLSRRLARPITAVSSAAQQLAQGDLSARAPLLSGEREVAELARSFNEMAENLQALERERQQAVADIAHELRTPIAVMQARLDALEDGVYPLNTDQIGLLSAQTQLLTRLVGDLRTLTLLDAGRLALNPRIVNLAELTGQVVAELQDQAAARGIHLNLRATPATVRADPDRVRQIINNLIENAVTHAAHRVDVQVSTAHEQATLQVDDDGPGIPAESREAVFTRFTRLDESRSRNTGGSGLGLAIVRALTEAQGGQARASHSTLGGAKFTVNLPQLAGSD